ncbi:hypothetical protein [Hahella sp. NBU794]|uniref:hypothetical protein n=1 Tax=Hahella sp. NBU794 TaxID=3422590 RepID=UPI003D6F9318
MLEKINAWIDDTNRKNYDRRHACTEFAQAFAGFYSSEFLASAYFVVTDDIPRPDFPELRQMGFGAFIDMPVNGTTYKDTYYIRSSAVSELRVHFHELVHVVQWRELGALNFIQRYMKEILTCGYANAPLEIMAYDLDKRYGAKVDAFDIPEYVIRNL